MTLPLDDVDRERVGDPSSPIPRASRRRLDMTATAAAAAATVTDLASGLPAAGADTGADTAAGPSVDGGTATLSTILTRCNPSFASGCGDTSGNMVRAVDEVFPCDSMRRG